MRTLQRCVNILLFFALAIAAPAQETGPLAHIADLSSDVTSHRSSSYDKTGGNNDAIRIKAGETATLADISGAGSIRHIWITINSPSPFHLRELVLRMYWDGNPEASVEVPIGDFFGTGFEYEDIPGGHTGQRYHSWQSLPLTVQGRALSSYFEMPFSKGGRITLTNDGTTDVPSFYYQIDYQSYADASVTAKQGRFHAQWRSEVTRAVPPSETGGINLDGKNNYLFFHAKGQGQLVGVILAIQGLSSGWWGEGDDMYFIDGATSPATVNGTGTEDAFGSAWQFGEEFNYPFVGYSSKGNRDWSGTHVMYRFFLQDPIYFSRSIVGGIEHGHANDRSDLYTSVTFWYQKGHQTLDPLPPVKDRLPRPFHHEELLEHDLPN
jgi:Protein of unknown function (DUF2961)